MEYAARAGRNGSRWQVPLCHQLPGCRTGATVRNLPRSGAYIAELPKEAEGSGMTVHEQARSLLIERARALLDALPDDALPEALGWLQDTATYWQKYRQVLAIVQPPLDHDSPIEPKTYTVFGSPWSIP